MNNKHQRSLERMYLAAPLNQVHYPTTEIEVGEATAQIALTVDTTYHHAAGGMHGSVYFKLLDDAAYFAVASLVEDVFVLTKHFEVDLKHPFATGRIVATGTIIRSTEEGFEAESSLRNELGKVLALGHGIFVKGPTPLAETEGYRT